MGTIFMRTENGKTSDPLKFVNLLQRLDIGSSNKHVALQNLPIYYTRKNIREQYEINFKIIALIWYNEHGLPDGYSRFKIISSTEILYQV